MSEVLKKADGTKIPGLLVAQAGNPFVFQFAADSHTCEDLRTTLSKAADPLTIIDESGTEMQPITGYGVFDSAQLMPTTKTGCPEDRIYVMMRQATQTEKLKAFVAAGTITAEQYKAITGEDYAA